MASHTSVSSTLPFVDLWLNVPAAFTDLLCGLKAPAPLIS